MLSLSQAHWQHWLQSCIQWWQNRTEGRYYTRSISCDSPACYCIFFEGITPLAGGFQAYHVRWAIFSTMGILSVRDKSKQAGERHHTNKTAESIVTALTPTPRYLEPFTHSSSTCHFSTPTHHSNLGMVPIKGGRVACDYETIFNPVACIG